MARLLAYWGRHMAGAPALLELPEALTRPERPDPRGAAVERWVAGPLVHELNALARRESATQFMVLLAAFQVLLAARTGTWDVVVGTDIAGRSRSETEGLIGFFINQLALRTDLSGDPTFRALLGRVREVALGAYAHQDLPFERLVEELKVPRDLRHAPVFQVKLVLQNAPQAALDLKGVALRTVAVEPETSQLDLNLRVLATAGGLHLSMAYSTAVYNASTIERLLTQFETLLRASVERPEAHLSELAAELTAADRSRQAERDAELRAAGRAKLRNVRRQAAAGQGS